MTNADFSRAAAKFLKALRYRHRGRVFEYLKVNEWRNGVQHCHALLRVSGCGPRRSVREAKRIAGLRCSVEPIENVLGVASYLFKYTRRPERKAELTPETFRGRMYTVLKGFLTKPFKELWLEVRSLEVNSRKCGISG